MWVVARVARTNPRAAEFAFLPRVSVDAVALESRGNEKEASRTRVCTRARGAFERAFARYARVTRGSSRDHEIRASARARDASRATVKRGRRGRGGCFGKTARARAPSRKELLPTPHRRSQSPTRTSGYRASRLETRDAQTLPPSTEGFSTPAPPDPGGLLRIVDAIEYDSNTRETCPFSREPVKIERRACPAQHPRQKLPLETRTPWSLPRSFRFIIRALFPLKNLHSGKKSTRDIVCQKKPKKRSREFLKNIGLREETDVADDDWNGDECHRSSDDTARRAPEEAVPLE